MSIIDEVVGRYVLILETKNYTKEIQVSNDLDWIKVVFKHEKETYEHNKENGHIYFNDNYVILRLYDCDKNANIEEYDSRDIA